MVYMIYMGVSINGGTPIAGWFVKCHLELDDDWRYPYFRKPPYATHDINMLN